MCEAETRFGIETTISEIYKISENKDHYFDLDLLLIVACGYDFHCDITRKRTKLLNALVSAYWFAWRRALFISSSWPNALRRHCPTGLMSATRHQNHEYASLKLTDSESEEDWENNYRSAFTYAAPNDIDNMGYEAPKRFATQVCLLLVIRHCLI